MGLSGRICLVDEKKGVGKVDEEDNEIRIKIMILSSCQGGPYPKSSKKEVHKCD
jgi:hypothetical protein